MVPGHVGKKALSGSLRCRHGDSNENVRKISKRAAPFVCTILCRQCTMDACVSHDVGVASQWYHENGMLVNESKHQCLILGDTEYGFSFPVKDTLEIFGMEIDNNLNFSKHISNVCKKINNQFNVIDYFPIPHNTLCLPPKFCITYCLKMLLGKCNTPRSI